jgi:hypothetical protein
MGGGSKFEKRENVAKINIFKMNLLPYPEYKGNV